MYLKYLMEKDNACTKLIIMLTFRLFCCSICSYCTKPSQLPRSNQQCNKVCEDLSHSDFSLHICYFPLIANHKLSSSSNYRTNSLLMSVSIQSTDEEVNTEDLLQEFPVVIYFTALKKVCWICNITSSMFFAIVSPEQIVHKIIVYSFHKYYDRKQQWLEHWIMLTLINTNSQPTSPTPN